MSHYDAPSDIAIFSSFCCVLCVNVIGLKNKKKKICIALLMRNICLDEPKPKKKHGSKVAKLCFLLECGI